MLSTTILSAGRDRALLYTRNRVLEEAGYLVTPAITPAEITECCFKGGFDLVVLCHSIPQQERKRIARLVRMHTPSTPVIVLADMPTRKYEFGDLTVYSEAANLLSCIPEALKSTTERRPSAPAHTPRHVSAPRPRRSA